jgi:CBS domain-containing protein
MPPEQIGPVAGKLRELRPSGRKTRRIRSLDADQMRLAGLHLCSGKIRGGQNGGIRFKFKCSAAASLVAMQRPGSMTMRTSCAIAGAAGCVLYTQAACAQQETPGATVLAWLALVVIVLLVSVAIRLFFLPKRRSGKERLGDLLQSHEPSIHAVDPDVAVADCVRYMNEQDIGAVLVLEKDRLVGIFTERDAITKVLGAGLEPTYTKISAVMSYNPTCVAPATTVDEALAIVSRQRIRHLPVVEGNKVLGVISSGDLIQHLVKS